MYLLIFSVIIYRLNLVVTVSAISKVINFKPKIIFLIITIISERFINIFINNIKYTIFETSSDKLSNLYNVLVDVTFLTKLFPIYYLQIHTSIF